MGHFGNGVTSGFCVGSGGFKGVWGKIKEYSGGTEGFRKMYCCKKKERGERIKIIYNLLNHNTGIVK